MIFLANHRLDRLSEDIKRDLSAIIRDLKDPRIPLVVSVTNVTVTPDLKFAKVYVSMLINEDDIKNAINALNSASGFIRRELSQKVDIRNTPQLTFVFDDSIEYGAKINKILKGFSQNEQE